MNRDLKKICEIVSEITQMKSESYHDAMHKYKNILKIMFPDGIPVDRYEHLYPCLRILDKVVRILTGKNLKGDDDYLDIAGYAMNMLDENKIKNILEEMLE